MVEARNPETLAQLLGEPLFVPEHNSFDDPSPFAAESRRDRPSETRAEPIGHSAQPASSSDLVPPIGAQDDVDAVPPEPRPLVESVLRRARKPHGGDSLEDRSLRRRAAEGQLQQDRLTQSQPAEAAHLPRDTKLEP